MQKRVCINCGYEAKKFYKCKKCGKFVCYKCINRGLCNDCFTMVECENYSPNYEYERGSNNEI